jgi:hypothetical protein
MAEFMYLLMAVTNHLKDSGKAGYIPFEFLHNFLSPKSVNVSCIKFKYFYAYGCKIYFPILKVKHRLKVLEVNLLKNLRRGREEIT